VPSNAAHLCEVVVKPPRARDEYLVLDQSGSAASVTKPYAWTVSAMAFGLMVVDFIDRQLVVAAFPYLKAEWGLTDKQLGALVSVVSVTVALGAFPTALLADRWSRVKSIAAMGTTWSVATLAGGFAQNFAQLFAARALVGAGEAGYGPAAGALLSTLFPASKRATVLGAFQAAAGLGTVLGVVLGGIIAARWGWRAAFGVLAIPGLVLAVAFLRLRDYRTLRITPAAGSARQRLRATLAELFRARSGLAAIIGGAFQLMVVSTLYTWLPSYLNRSHGLAVDRAASLTGLVIMAGMIGTVAFAHLADRRGSRDPRARLRVPAVLSIATLALLTTAFTVRAGPLQIALILAGGLTMTAAVGPVAAVMTDVVHPGLRATAISTLTVVQNLLGLAIGPLLTGLLADLYGLPTALTVMPAACGVAAVAFWYGSGHYVRDRDAVTSSITSV
jgi:MFS transporter, Spinster family, sphingosine-1-phosphate transporter